MYSTVSLQYTVQLDRVVYCRFVDLSGILLMREKSRGVAAVEHRSLFLSAGRVAGVGRLRVRYAMQMRRRLFISSIAIVYTVQYTYVLYCIYDTLFTTIDHFTVLYNNLLVSLERS